MSAHTYTHETCTHVHNVTHVHIRTHTRILHTRNLYTHVHTRNVSTCTRHVHKTRTHTTHVSITHIRTHTHTTHVHTRTHTAQRVRTYTCRHTYTHTHDLNRVFSESSLVPVLDTLVRTHGRGRHGRRTCRGPANERSETHEKPEVRRGRVSREARAHYGSRPGK